MRNGLILLLWLFASCGVSAQFHDNHWLLGYLGGDETPSDDSLGISIISFYDGGLKIENDQEIDIFFNGSGNSMSDYYGDLLMYSNNLEIRNNEDELLNNGMFEDGGDSESILPQSFVFLPFYLDEIIHFFRMTYSDGSPQVGKDLTAYFIEGESNPAVVGQIDSVLVDSLTTGELTACRHANGRDWWVLVASANKPWVYSVPVNPEGISSIDTLHVGFAMQSGLGQAKFSPDGNRFVRYNGVRIGEDDYLDIFDFDRKTGELSNYEQIIIPDDGVGGGVAISPSSQFLYISHHNHIFQYDLWADDIFATLDTVATYNGYTEWNFFHGRFYLSELAPDGKIYVNHSSGIKKLTVIDYPDKRGEACSVRQHAIALPNANAFTLANHPNYRLGPLDGSPADTLGLDNLPRAYYRTDRNAEDTLAFHFQDLSFYEPETWSWTFGDGAGSTDRHPDHTYASPGIYEVCLTVSNANGSDTECRTLELGPSSITSPETLDITTFPNPVQDVLVFDLGDYLPLNGRFRLYDAAGREVFSEGVLERQAQFRLGYLPVGTYHYTFRDGGITLGKGMVVKGR